MGQIKNIETLLLLVGSNPLPNFLASLILKPSKILFFYTPETKNVMEKLRNKLLQKTKGLSITEKLIADATNPKNIIDAFQSIPSGSHLHYTGGTKIMAAHARMAFKTAGGEDHCASYMDERKGILRFDDGYEINLVTKNFRLEMDDVLGLHGIERSNKNKPFTHMPTQNDANIICTSALTDKSKCIADRLYCIHREEGKPISVTKAKENPIDLSDILPENFCIRQIPESTWGKNEYFGWCKFLGGGWLETWCTTLVNNLLNDAEVSTGMNCKLENGRNFEIDLAVIRGHRLYVISCTIDNEIRLCKSKLFEVAMRARQLGGDLARSALVCLLDGRDQSGSYVDQLRNDVTSVWNSPNTPQVFGMDDLKEWAGINGSPNTNSIYNWLKE